ncbi:FtsX-like permease family protein [Cryobacterium soli]|uniref:FtsX-like permease family protein n=1 Tax=Cryobacterium soli TaxID=2220095 RepID=UPI000E707C9E|nr:ABC transporter permease [Cryobacterium soli]
MLAVSVIAGTVLTGSLLLVRSAEEAGVRASLASMTADRVAVTVRVLNPGTPVTGTRADIDRATEQAYGAGVDWSSSGWVTSEWVTTAEGVYASLAELDDPAAAATLVAGDWPTSPEGVAMPQTAASSLGLTIGDTFSAAVGERPIAFRVDGLYQADPDSGVFWENDPLAASGNDLNFPEPDRYIFNPVHGIGPLLVARGGVDASGIRPAQLEVVENPTFTAIDAAGLGLLQDRIDDAETGIARGISFPDGTLIIDTEIATALADVTAGLSATREVALIIALILLVVAAAAASAVTRLLIVSRAGELELLTARGASRRQIASAVALDAAVVAVIIAAVSPWGGVLLHATVVRVPPLAAVGLEPWVAPDAWSWLVAAVVAVTVAGLLCLPASMPHRLRRSLPTGTVAVAAGSTVIVLSGLLVWRATAAAPPPGDILLAATPAVLLIATALIGSRLASTAAHPVAALAGRSRGAVAPLVGWFASRAPGRSAGITLIALAVGASVVVLGTAATWQQAVRDTSAVAVGAPTRIAPGPGTSTDKGAAPVIRRDTLLSKFYADAPGDSPAVAVQVLGPDARARSLLDRGPVAAAGGSAVVTELGRTDPEDSGPALEPGTAGVRAEVTFSAPESVEAEVSMVLADRIGVLTVVPLGTVSAGITTVASTDGFPPTGDGATRLVAITMQVRDAAELPDPVSVELSMTGWTAVHQDGTLGEPVPVTDAGQWQGSADGELTDPPVVSVSDSTIRLSAAAQLGTAPITFGAVGWNPRASVAAVIPDALADDLDVLDGARLTGFFSGATVNFTVVGSAATMPGAATVGDLRALEAGLPSLARSTTTIVVDGRALAHHLVQGSAAGSLVDEFWLDEAEAGVSAPVDASVTTSAGVAQRMLEAPLRAEILAATLVTAATSVLLALAGFGARAAAVSRSRRLEAAQLRAVGLSRRGMVGVSAIDNLTIAAAGILVGLAGGLATLALVGPRIASGGGATAASLVVPWLAVTLLPLGLLGALAVISLGIAVGQRRLPLADLLRTGADG